jgi:hypothetical protein
LRPQKSEENSAAIVLIKPSPKNTEGVDPGQKMVRVRIHVRDPGVAAPTAGDALSKRLNRQARQGQ